MPKAGRELTDADLLGGDDDDAVDDAALEGLDDLGGEDLAAELTAERGADEDGKGKDDDLEVVIVDEDQGREPERREAEEEAAAGAEYDADADSGEEIDEDLLTAEERKAYSKGVQKRIQRERRLKAEERARADAAEGERARLAAELLESQKGFATLLSAMLAKDIEAKTAALLKAKEDGETKDEVKLQTELNDLQARKREADAVKERLDKSKPAPSAQTENPMAERWMSRNSAWYKRPGFTAATASVQALDRELSAEFKAGRFRFGPTTNEYFVELDRRLHRELPALRTQVRSHVGTPRPKVAAPARGAPPQRKVLGKGKVELTRADLENMQTFGLDTKDPKVLREYARQKAGGGLNG